MPLEKGTQKSLKHARKTLNASGCNKDTCRINITYLCWPESKRHKTEEAPKLGSVKIL